MQYACLHPTPPAWLSWDHNGRTPHPLDEEEEEEEVEEEGGGGGGGIEWEEE